MKILIFYSTAGEGHKRVAEAIQEELQSKQGVASVRALDAFEKAGRLFQKGYPLVYFYLVKCVPKFWGALYEATDGIWSRTFLRPLRTFWNRSQSGLVRRFVQEEKPDMIISTHFYAAEIFASAKRRGEIQTKLVTVVTDVIPHSFWINPGTDVYWVMAEESKEELLRRGIPKSQIVVGGIPINQKFTRQENREELLNRLGMRQSRFNILFSSGSFGIGPTEQWLKELEDYGKQIQVIVVCGLNGQLFDALAKQKYTFPMILTGFIHNMYEFMSVADVLIAKSGGATTCESLAKNLPMLISAPIPGQETRNAKWLVKNEAAIEIKFQGELKSLIQNILEDHSILERLKVNIKRIAKPNAAQDLANFLIQSNS